MLAKFFRRQAPSNNRWARQVEAQLAERGSAAGRTAADPQLINAVELSSLDRQPRIIFGRVVDALAYLNVYKVQWDVIGTRPGILSCDVSTRSIGVKDTTTLLPGTQVWGILPPNDWIVWIGGCLPEFGTDSTLSLADQIHQASRSGFLVDGVHSFPLGLNGGAGIGDFSADRPIDATMLGEWGRKTETGLGFHLDSMMVSATVNEACGIWGLYLDSLLRIAGYNLQIRTAGSELEALNDQGEWDSVHSWTPYPWEHLGAFATGQTLTRTLTPQESQIDTPWYSGSEPIHDDQYPFARVLELSGYIGQGKRRIISLPPATGVNRLSVDTPYFGVLQEAQTLDGRHVIQAARGVLLVKRPKIAVPKRRKLAHDPTGDGVTNYKAAGLTGDGDDHVITSGPTTDQPNAAQIAIAGVMDSLAHLFNWALPHPVHYHTKDWYLPEDDALDTVPAYAPNFADLQSKQFLPAPTPVVIPVDHRSSAEYYPGESVQGILPDGSHVAHDPTGSSDQTSGGSRTISVPGDLILQAGRRIILQAGDDLIVLAQNSVDLSAGRDLRIKAEHQLEALAGNSGTGAILLESRGRGREQQYSDQLGEAVRANGVVIKTASDFAVISKNIYLRTVDYGDIILDADQAAGQVITHASQVIDHVSGAVYHCFVDENNIHTVNLFTRAGTDLGSQLFVNGQVVADGSLLCNGWIVTLTGHFASTEADSYERVPALQAASARTLRTQLDELRTNNEKTIVASSNANFERIQNAWYQDAQLGSSTLIADIGFSWRTEEQYGTTEYACFEARWQQQSRLTGQTLPTWTEHPVLTRNAETYPFPGKRWWVDEAAYFTVDLNLYDDTTGDYVPRGEAYHDPKFAEPEGQPLSKFPVTSRPA